MTAARLGALGSGSGKVDNLNETRSEIQQLHREKEETLLLAMISLPTLSDERKVDVKTSSS